MAVPDGLPSDVVQFVNDSIDSIEQLESLVMLINSSHRYWDAASAGRALGVNPGTTQRDTFRELRDELVAVLFQSDAFQESTWILCLAAVQPGEELQVLACGQLQVVVRGPRNPKISPGSTEKATSRTAT